MSQAVPVDALTAEDLFLISSDEGHQELDRGMLVRMPPAGGLHGKLSARIGRLLDEHVDAAGLGVVCGAETGFILQRNPDIVRAPDAAFVARNRIPAAGTPEGYWALAPDLAVEVVSSSDRIAELDTKIDQYFAAGTRLVWVLHPRRRAVHVYRSPTAVRVLGEADELVADAVLPGFRCLVSRVFD